MILQLSKCFSDYNVHAIQPTRVKALVTIAKYTLVIPLVLGKALNEKPMDLHHQLAAY